MGSKMLIDAAHPEETRVVVVRGNRVEDFDFESATRKQLRGNIYLAKVTRVEPSLQAAFVDYGGNRHGFLAFNEIHPDYYQIPVADRQLLLDEEAEEESQAAAEEAREDEEASPGDDTVSDETETPAENETVAAAADDDGNSVSEDAPAPDDSSESENENSASESELADAPKARGLVEDQGLHDVASDASPEDNGDSDDEVDVESVGSEDALEEVPQRKRRPRRIYKIQEVIKRRQIILVQVVKEERGNKGAALTTYLSLAGRYTVLMPNTARGGGISRKISNPTDRRRLRKIVAELEVPSGRGLIVRTAGASRTKAEIKRDFEYLLRLWENIRDLTLHSTAPCLVYEEGNLIKRSIRDLYSKEIDEVLVAGDHAYKEAKGFMRMLMPSHAKNVQPYKEPEPIFVRYKIERQLAAMFSPFVTLKSGGYIVINQTEALVAVDVNSGKATREHNIEDTALRTNVEAAEEIARQLRLRDLAGLIVIDFIDMEERRNNRTVERKLKECLRNDRARIQVGRISHFGLLEMSRQRLRAGVLEGTTSQCPMCQGTGLVRSTESVALDVLRSLEDTLLTQGRSNMAATTSVEVALYILNHKHHSLRDIEQRYGVEIVVQGDDELHGAQFKLEQTATSGEDAPSDVVVQMDWALQNAEEEKAKEASTETSEDSDGEKKKPRRRRRRRRGRGEQSDEAAAVDANAEKENDEETAEVSSDQSQSEDNDAPPRRRRRGRRGGRRNRQARAAAEANGEAAPNGAEQPQMNGDGAAVQSPADRDTIQTAEEPPADDAGTAAKPNEPHNTDGKQPDKEAAPSVSAEEPTQDAPPPSVEASTVTEDDQSPAVADETLVSEEAGAPQERRRGWWQRRFY